MPMSKYSQTDPPDHIIAFVVTIGILVILAAVFSKKPEPREPINVDEVAAEVTQAAGKNLTKGVIQAIKEEMGD
jgi:hypothetical protein